MERKHHNMKSHGHLDDRYLDTPVRHLERYQIPPRRPRGLLHTARVDARPTQEYLGEADLTPGRP